MKRENVRLAPEPAAVAEWTTPHKVDPFTTSVEQNLDLLLKVDAEMRAVPGVTLAETGMNFQREESWFLSSEGSRIHQTKYSTGAGYTAYAFAGSEIQKRSYPNSFGGHWQNRGYELIEEMKLLENARRVAEEAVALHQAEQCPEGTATIILDGSQLGLQIHESIGHPIELDRVLGMEANFAGTSFLTLEKLGICATAANWSTSWPMRGRNTDRASGRSPMTMKAWLRSRRRLSRMGALLDI